jgi:class III poly(R)-hydroxyalkanoic acid synthase PhaE subunit
MDKKDKSNDTFDELLTMWMKTTGEFWNNMFRTWSEMGRNVPFQSMAPESGSSSRVQASMLSTIKNYQALSEAFFEPSNLESLLKGTGAMPEILAKLAQSVLAGFVQMQQKTMERAGRVGESVEAYQFEDLDENAFRAWADIYEKEISQFLNVPQLGLTRFYQERVNRALDKFNIFQATFAEFLRLLYLPMNRSMAVMQDKLGKLAESGQLPEDSKTYYQMWIKTLEGHYMTLFQSAEYVQTLEKTLRTLSDFSKAKDEVVEDMLNALPIPKQKDMDELYREIYILKKRIKSLEKKKRGETQTK